MRDFASHELVFISHFGDNALGEGSIRSTLVMNPFRNYRISTIPSHLIIRRDTLIIAWLRVAALFLCCSSSLAFDDVGLVDCVFVVALCEGGGVSERSE